MIRIFLSMAAFLLMTVGRVAAVTDDALLPEQVVRLTDSIKSRYAPDSRVALLEIDYSFAGKRVMLRGVTTSKAARKALLDGLEGMGYEVMDCLKVLPDDGELGGKTYGVVDLSVCNIHVKPDFASEMTTQALLGTPVRVLQYDGWYRIQTPDHYIAWVHRAGIHPMTADELAEWNGAEKVVVTSHYGFVHAAPDAASPTVSDVVAGNRLKWLGTKGGYYRVGYPDGRSGYLPKSAALPEHLWRERLAHDVPSILKTAQTMMGIPYLWAGMSSKGMDCSGFVRNVLFMHDIIIPRDASQQAYTGQRIEIAPGCANLQPGDLIFFGRKAADGRKERVVHVGFYMGGSRFIHSQGDVHVSSLDASDALFDAFNLNRLLFAVRLLPYVGREAALNTTATNPYYATSAAMLPAD